MVHYYIVHAQSSQSAHKHHFCLHHLIHVTLCKHAWSSWVDPNCQELPPLLLGRQALVLVVMSQKVGTAAVCTELNVYQLNI